MILSEAPIRTALIVTGFEAGESCRSHLAGLGIIPGTPIRVLSRGAGPVLIELRDSRLALGQGMAQKILVCKGV